MKAELLRRAWRRSRTLPLVRSAVGVLEAARWSRIVRASGLVDAELVAAQLGYGSLSHAAAVRAYTHGGFRRGVTVNAEFDEGFMAARLPETGRVPAVFAYALGLRNRSVDPRDFTTRDPEAGVLSRRTALAAAAQWAIGTAEIAREADDLPSETTTVIVVISGDDDHPAERLRAAIAVADRVTAVAVGVGASTWLLIAGMVESTPRLAASLVAADVDLEAAVAERLPSGGRYVVIDADMRPPAAAISALLKAAAPDRIAVPVHLAFDGTIGALGRAVVGGREFPVLRGLPVEDLAGLGGASVRVPGRWGLTRAGLGGIAGGMEVWAHPDIRFPVVKVESRSRYVASGDDSAEAESLYRRAGFDVTDWCTEAAPTLRRRSVAPRWAVKVASPAGSVGDIWGDTHFGESLAGALRRRGIDAVVDRREAANRATASFDDVHLVVRGPTRIRPPRHGVRVLWIISHPHEISDDELDEFDLIFAASGSWSAEATRRFGRPVHALLECTDATSYYPRGLARNHDILFVGKSRDVPRRVVIAPIEAGIDVKVYGPDWAAFIPDSSVVRSSVPLSALPAMYESAGVVLNDQWAEMRAAGFPAMRPFDVIAAGGRVISEEVDGLSETLGPGVVTYSDEKELISMLRHTDLDGLFPSEEVLLEYAQRARQIHSFDARAQTLADAVEEHLRVRPDVSEPS